MAFEGLSEKLNGVFKRLRGKGRLTEADVREGMREVRLALLEADVSYKVVKDFVADVTEKCVGTDVLDSLTPAQQIIKIVNQELTALMGGTNARLTTASKGPTVVMMVGLQGAGKTTNGAKLAGLMRRSFGKRPLLVACDVYRPAAINQLQVVGKQLDIPVFEMGQIDPVTIAKEAVKYAADHGHDIVFLDTAGRLHIDEALMDELKAVKAAVHPNEILLVVDAMTGQDAVNAAKAFDDALGIDGVLLTKLDGDARGGAALSIRAVTGKPIKFVGTGEKLDMIEPFHPDRMASRILGMGDVLTLIEKAEQSFDEKKALEAAEKLRANKFSLSDYLDQMAQLKNMGDLQDLAGMIPGPETKEIVSYLPERTYFADWMTALQLLDFFGDFYDDFDRAAVLAVLEQNAARAAEKAAAIPEYPRHGKTGIQPTKVPQTAPKQDGVQRLVDIEQKMAEGKGRGYERWATMHNLKQMAATLNVYQEYGFTSPEQLEAAVDTAYQEMRQTSGKLKTLEIKLQGKKELQQQVLAYAKTKPTREGLKAQKSEKARAAYRQANESDFIIADAAARYFKAHGITKLPARKALQAEIEQLISEKDGLYNTYHEQKQRFKELQTVKRNIDQILRRDEPHRRKEQSHER